MRFRNKGKRWTLFRMLVLLAITTMYAPKMGAALFRNIGSILLTHVMAQSPGLTVPVLEPVMDLHLGQSALVRSASMYEWSLKWNPLDARSRYSLGSILFVTGQYSNAITSLSTATDLGATDSLVYLRLGSVLWNSGDHTSAVAAFQRAKATDFLISRGDQYNAHAILSWAETYYQVALLTCERTRGYSGLGRVRQTQGRWQESRDYFLRALQMDPNNVDAEFGLGNVFLYSLGEPLAARPHLQHAVDLEPGMWAYLLMGDSYRLDNDYAEASRWYARAATADPSSEQPQIFQGWNLQAQGRLDGALEMFHAAQSKNPSAAQPDAALAALYVQQGEWAQAIDYYQSAIQKEPWNAWHHIWLGDVYLAAGQVAEATAEYLCALELSPENPTAQQRMQGR